MSTDLAAIAGESPTARSAWDAKTISVVRYAVGVTSAVALAFAIEWPLAMLTPILTARFLATPMPHPTLKMGVGLFSYVLIAFSVGLCFTLFLLPYPLVYAVALFIILFHLFYYLNRRGSMYLAIMVLLAVVVLPVLATANEALAVALSIYFTFSAGVAVVLLLAAHALIPNPPVGGSRRPKPAKITTFSRPAAQAALKSALVLTPLALLFISATLTNIVPVLIFSTFFVLQPGLNAGKGAGLSALASNLLGGLAALVMHLLLAVVPG